MTLLVDGLVKRFGRQVVRIAFDGEGRADGPDRLGWLGSFPGVRLSRPGADYAELTTPTPPTASGTGR
jgi:hypothetical protein